MTIAPDDFVSLEVTKNVFEDYSYRFNESESDHVAVVFDNFKEPIRAGMKRITIQGPEALNGSGVSGYRQSKLVNVISLVHGLGGGMGEVIARIKLKRDELH